MAPKNLDDVKARFAAGRGIWDEDWESLWRLNPTYLERYLSIRDASQNTRHLSPKVQEFIYLACAACTTHIHAPAIRAHTKAALQAGATQEEIFDVIGLTYLVGIHTVTNGARILMELQEELGIQDSGPSDLDDEKKRIKDSFVRQRGFWTDTWNPVLDLNPHFFEAYTEFSAQSAQANVLDAPTRELITCAFDASTTHLYHTGTKIHMRNALKLGATPGQVMEMLEIVSLQGIDGVVTAASILSDEVSAHRT